jgi:hypothetical protein
MIERLSQGESIQNHTRKSISEKLDHLKPYMKKTNH